MSRHCFARLNFGDMLSVNILDLLDMLLLNLQNKTINLDWKMQIIKVLTKNFIPVFSDFSAMKEELYSPSAQQEHDENTTNSQPKQHFIQCCSNPVSPFKCVLCSAAMMILWWVDGLKIKKFLKQVSIACLWSSVTHKRQIKSVMVRIKAAIVKTSWLSVRSVA